jgi:hypothetical protein
MKYSEKNALKGDQKKINGVCGIRTLDLLEVPKTLRHSAKRSNQQKPKNFCYILS